MFFFVFPFYREAQLFSVSIDFLLFFYVWRVDSRSSFALWLCQQHNVVNKKLQKVIESSLCRDLLIQSILTRAALVSPLSIATWLGSMNDGETGTRTAQGCQPMLRARKSLLDTARIKGMNQNDENSHGASSRVRHFNSSTWNWAYHEVFFFLTLTHFKFHSLEPLDLF